MNPSRPSHHIVNMLAISVPSAAWLAQAPFYLSVVTGILGAIWYLILIGEKISAWRARHVAVQSSNRNNQSNNPAAI